MSKRNKYHRISAAILENMTIRDCCSLRSSKCIAHASIPVISAFLRPVSPNENRAERLEVQPPVLSIPRLCCAGYVSFRGSDSVPEFHIPFLRSRQRISNTVERACDPSSSPELDPHPAQIDQRAERPPHPRSRTHRFRRLIFPRMEGR